MGRVGVEPAQPGVETKMTKPPSAVVTRSDTATIPATGFFGRALSAIVKARQLQADREVENYLARQSDRMLRDIGMTDLDIEALRQKHNR